MFCSYFQGDCCSQAVPAKLGCRGEVRPFVFVRISTCKLVRVNFTPLKGTGEETVSFEEEGIDLLGEQFVTAAVKKYCTYYNKI